ncbi:MAG: radical SAM protein [Nannocystaceae bacterium]|nr:radical SAM protein [Nannocystaceae bacterium]
MNTARRIAIEVTLACDGACRFCAQQGLARKDVSAAAVAQAIAEAAAAGHEITLTGGEPTRRAELTQWVAMARELGAPAVGLQTHGRALADAALTTNLVDAGLTDIHLSIHGARPEVHDYHTSATGSLTATLDGLRALRQRGPEITVVASTVVTRSNFRVLAELPARLRAWGVTAWSLRWPQTTGGAEAAFDRIVPRLGLAAPFVLHAAAVARREGLAVVIAGLPSCVLGPMAELAQTTRRRSHGEVCNGCPSYDGCPGVDAHYLRRFGPGELHRVDERMAARPTGANSGRTSPALARMFVGIGRTAPPRTLTETVADSPQRARARLPVLGRPDPAEQEVRRHDTPNTAALPGLFPALFDADNDADNDVDT